MSQNDLYRPPLTWAKMKKQARALPDTELRKHALVSTSNRHACVDCFCCACLVVLHERGKVELAY